MPNWHTNLYHIRIPQDTSTATCSLCSLGSYCSHPDASWYSRNLRLFALPLLNYLWVAAVLSTFAFQQARFQPFQVCPNNPTIQWSDHLLLCPMARKRDSVYWKIFSYRFFLERMSTVLCCWTPPLTGISSSSPCLYVPLTVPGTSDSSARLSSNHAAQHGHVLAAFFVEDILASFISAFFHFNFKLSVSGCTG